MNRALSRRLPLLAVFALLAPAVAAIAACGTSTDSDAGNTLDASPADASADAGSTFSQAVLVYESMVDDAGNTVPIPGASVCVNGFSGIPCGTTDGSGASAISSPPLTAGDGSVVDFAVTASAPGHLGTTLLDDYAPLSGYLDNLNFPLMSDAVASAMAAQAGFTYPANGTAFVFVFIGEGASATLSPASGVGPVYFDDAGTATPSLTAASVEGYVAFGNVTPGPITVTVTSPDYTCTANIAGGITIGDWAGPTANSISGVAVANSATMGMSLPCGR